jgi:Ca-activated chloride channel homolog
MRDQQRHAAMTPKKYACALLVGCLFCFFLQTVSGQETPTIRAEVALVNVVFTTMDRNGQPVRGLKASDFQVFEDRQPQKIEYFSELGKGSEVPLTVALLIDTSGSVKDNLDYEITTAAEFFREILRPNKDLALIIQFDSDVNLVQDFTQSQSDLLRALRSLRAGNSTALYDAVFLAADEKLKNETGRKVIVVITDGDDNSSRVRKEQAIDAAQKSDVLIYGIGVRSKETNFGVLKKFAAETGGAFFSPHAKLSEIQDAFQSIGRELQGQYSLAYSSTNKTKDGSFRTIDLRCKISGVRIRARKGYYAPRQEPEARSKE